MCPRLVLILAGGFRGGQYVRVCVCVCACVRACVRARLSAAGFGRIFVIFGADLGVLGDLGDLRVERKAHVECEVYYVLERGARVERTVCVSAD